MDHEEQVSPSKPSESKPKPNAKTEKPAWKAHSPAEMAAHLLATPTLADRTWTDEQRLKGEKREAFIRRILLGETGETGETSGTVDTDETVGTDETAAQAGIPAAPAAGGASVVEKLEALGVRGILWQLAREDHRRALRDAPVLLLPRS